MKLKTGIAGGIGSGKSYVAQRLAARGIQVYDCDAAAKRLMRESAELRRKLTELIGPDCYLKKNSGNNCCPSPTTAATNAGGSGASARPVVTTMLNKAAVTRFLLASENNARAIDRIVHPAVFDDFIRSGCTWMESAIMYESGADKYVDHIIVVTCPDEIRLERIMHRDKISREKAQQWIARQWPQSRTRKLADFEIVNDGTTDIDQQLNIILEQLCNKPF